MPAKELIQHDLRLKLLSFITFLIMPLSLFGQDWRSALEENAKLFDQDKQQAIRWANLQLAKAQSEDQRYHISTQLANFFHADRQYKKCASHARSAFVIARNTSGATDKLAFVPPMIKCHWKLTVDSRLDTNIIDPIEAYASSLPKKTMQAKLHLLLGKLYDEQKIPEVATDYYFRALNHSAIDTIDKADTHFQLGNLFLNKAILEIAKDHFQEALKVYIELEDKQREVQSLMGLANIASQQKQFPAAVDYISQAKRLTPVNYSPLFVEIMLQSGLIELNRENYAKAEQEFRTGIIASNKISYTKMTSNLQAGLGLALAGQKKFSYGFETLKKLWQEPFESQYPTLLNKLTVGIAYVKFLLHQDKQQEAIESLRLIRQEARQNKDHEALRTAVLLLARTHQNLGDVQAANKLLSEFVEENGLLLSASVKRQYELFNSQLNFKNANNTYLKSENLRSRQEKALAKKTMWFVIIIACSVLFVIATLFIVNGKRLQYELENSQKENNKKIELLNAAIEALRVKDTLTDLYNRNTLLELFEEFKQIGKHNHTNTCLLMITVDDYNEINARHGYDCSDFILKRVSVLLQKSLPEEDFIGRWNSEKFAVILPNTDQAHAVEVANTLRHEIERARYNYHQDGTRLELSVTISGVVVECTNSTSPINVLASKAIRELEKRDGKNQIIIEPIEPTPAASILQS